MQKGVKDVKTSKNKIRKDFIMRIKWEKKSRWKKKNPTKKKRQPHEKGYKKSPRSQRMEPKYQKITNKGGAITQRVNIRQITSYF